MEIYRSFNTSRNWDRLEYESLGLAIDALPGERIPHEEFLQTKTIEDVIRSVSTRRSGRG